MISTYHSLPGPVPRYRAALLGASAGLVVSGGVMLLAALSDATGSPDPVSPSLFGPTMIAGLAGGAVLGPRAVSTPWNATWRSRFGIRIRLALFAVFVGALVTGQQLTIASYVRIGDPTANVFAYVLVGTLISAYGMVFAGWFALPFTYVASVLWTWIMRRVAPPPG